MTPAYATDANGVRYRRTPHRSNYTYEQWRPEAHVWRAVEPAQRVRPANGESPVKVSALSWETEGDG